MTKKKIGDLKSKRSSNNIPLKYGEGNVQNNIIKINKNKNNHSKANTTGKDVLSNGSTWKNSALANIRRQASPVVSIHTNNKHKEMTYQEQVKTMKPVMNGVSIDAGTNDEQTKGIDQKLLSTYRKGSNKADINIGKQTPAEDNKYKNNKRIESSTPDQPKKSSRGPDRSNGTTETKQPQGQLHLATGYRINIIGTQASEPEENILDGRGEEPLAAAGKDTSEFKVGLATTDGGAIALDNSDQSGSEAAQANDENLAENTEDEVSLSEFNDGTDTDASETNATDIKNETNENEILNTEVSVTEKEEEDEEEEEEEEEETEKEEEQENEEFEKDEEEEKQGEDEEGLKEEHDEDAVQRNEDNTDDDFYDIERDTENEADENSEAKANVSEAADADAADADAVDVDAAGAEVAGVDAVAADTDVANADATASSMAVADTNVKEAANADAEVAPDAEVVSNAKEVSDAEKATDTVSRKSSNSSRKRLTKSKKSVLIHKTETSEAINAENLEEGEPKWQGSEAGEATDANTASQHPSSGHVRVETAPGEEREKRKEEGQDERKQDEVKLDGQEGTPKEGKQEKGKQDEVNLDGQEMTQKEGKQEEGKQEEGEQEGQKGKQDERQVEGQENDQDGQVEAAPEKDDSEATDGQAAEAPAESEDEPTEGSTAEATDDSVADENKYSLEVSQKESEEAGEDSVTETTDGLAAEESEGSAAEVSENSATETAEGTAAEASEGSASAAIEGSGAEHEASERENTENEDSEAQEASGANAATTPSQTPEGEDETEAMKGDESEHSKNDETHESDKSTKDDEDNKYEEEKQDYDILVINSEGECTDEEKEDDEENENHAIEQKDDDTNQQKEDNKTNEKDDKDATHSAEPDRQEGDDNTSKQEDQPKEAVTDEEAAAQAQKKQLQPYEEMVQVMRSGREEEQLAAVRRTRKQLSGVTSSPIDEYLAAGVLPPLRACLDKHHNPKLQFEALWVLTNVASGTTEQTKAVVDADCVPAFLRLLSSGSPEVREQAVWAVGNIMGDSAELRDRVIEEGAIPRLYDLTPGDNKDTSPINLAWTFTNVFRHKPWRLEEEQLAMCRKAVSVFFRAPSKNIQVDAVWSLAFMTDGGEEHANWVMESGFVPRLVEILREGDNRLVRPTLQTLGNLLQYSAHRRDVGLREGFIPSLTTHATDSVSSIRREAARVLALITTSGEDDLLDAALNAHLPTVLAIMVQDTEPAVLAVAAATAMAVASRAPKERLAGLVNNVRFIQALTELLYKQDSELIVQGLQATLTAVQRCAEFGLPLKGLDSILSSEQMTVLTRHERAEVSTLSNAAVAYYKEKHAAAQ